MYLADHSCVIAGLLPVVDRLRRLPVVTQQLIDHLAVLMLVT